ncbi:MAG: hypothetical protein JRE40_13555 [Deltaproteobacteria bacterium]|nr:hypothetical protein [Deltaproteobacteria bacterium]
MGFIDRTMPIRENEMATAATQSVGNLFTITHNNKAVVLITNDGTDHRTSDGTTAIDNGSVVGQKLTLIYFAKNAKTIKIKDNANTKLAGDWYTESQESQLSLAWDGTDWQEITRSDNGNINSSYGCASAGGSNNTNSDFYAGSLGGASNTNSQAYTGSVGGYTNTNEGNYSASVGGLEGRASLHAEQAQSAGKFAAVGDAQAVSLVARSSETHDSDTWRSLFLDGTDDLIVIKNGTGNDTVWTFEILIVGTTQGCAKSFGFHINGVIENDGGTTTLLASNVTTLYDTDDTDFDAQVAADDANDALLIQVKDSTSGSDVVRWVAHLRAACVTLPAA